MVWPVLLLDNLVVYSCGGEGWCMNTVFFFYTLTILIVCIVSVVLSAAAYASSRRRIFIYSGIAFTCYALELIEIFFFEYISQNMPFPATEYYAINSPVIRTLIATVLQGSIWAIALTYLDKHSKPLLLLPILAFCLANLLTLTLMPEGPWQQWTYYTLRQGFSYFVYGYGLWSYLRSTDEQYRTRLHKIKNIFIAAVVLSTCVLLEDTYIILIAPMSTHPDWLPLYLSERNFSENVLVCFFTVILVRQAYRVLSIRIKEAPAQEDVHDLDEHIDEIMPLFRQTNKLSERECEVLHLVVAGKSNQEIANELFLAVGTVKTHVHNIMKKTGQTSRETLVLHFWQS